MPSDSLFSEFKNKTEIPNAINKAELSRDSVSRKAECMSDDMNRVRIWNLWIF